MNRKLKTALAGAAGPVILTTVLAACSSSSHSSAQSATTAGGSSATSAATASRGAGSLVIGSADFTESELLADIYGDALQAKGVSVTKKLNIGERAVYWKAMQDGSINFIPEYNGSLLYYLVPTATAKSTSDVDSALSSAVGNQFTVLNAASAQDADTITVTKATADKYHLKSIGDLAPIASKLTFGAPAAFQTRADGIPALEKVYGVKFGTFTALSASGTIIVTSLRDGTINAGDIFSTDPSFAKYGFVALADPQNEFAAQNVTPIVASSKVTPTIQNTVNAVSAKLTTSTLAALDAEVGTGDPNATAQKWLASEGLS
jgi:osmoprotectant transport system substrate-binding protein